MNIYVETNFVLELTFEQEQCSSCEQILKLVETEQAKLIIPAYSLAEPHEKMTRQAKKRTELQKSLDAELRQLSRTASYKSRITSIQDIANLMVKSNEEEILRFSQYRERIFNIGEIVALTTDILKEAAFCESAYDLTPQDALVYASVINHLRCYKPPQAYFLNRNSKDFGNPDIEEELNQFNCKIFLDFKSGCNYIQSRFPS